MRFNGFHSDKGDTSIFKMVSFLLCFMALFLVCMYTVIQVNSYSRELDTKLKSNGIRRGLKAFMSSYSYDYSNLETIAEGYTKVEDFNEYEDKNLTLTILKSNPVIVNPKEAMDKFVEILSHNCGVKTENVRKWNFKIVQVYQTIAFDKISGKPIEKSSKYVLTYYSPQGNVQSDKTVYSNLDSAANAIPACLGVLNENIKTDLVGGIKNSIHKKTEKDTYARENNETKTASTYTSFFFVGADIPSKPVFGKSSDITFLDLQSFANQR